MSKGLLPVEILLMLRDRLLAEGFGGRDCKACERGMDRKPQGEHDSDCGLMRALWLDNPE